MFVQEINQSLEETALDVIGKLSIINSDIKLLETEATSFQGELNSIKQGLLKDIKAPPFRQQQDSVFA